MKILLWLLVFVTNIFAKSPFVGNSFSVEVLTEKSSIKSSRSFDGEGDVAQKDAKTSISPKSFQFSLANRFELSKYFMFMTETFAKLNTLNSSETSGEVKTKFTKGPFGYGIGIGIGIFTAPFNLLSIGTFCENMTIKFEDTSGDQNLDQDVKKSSTTKFLNGFKIENLTAFSKNKFMKISLVKPFNDKISACNGDHSISGVTIGVGLSVKF